MKPNRVPDDLIEAGFDAIRAWYAAHPSPNAYLDDRTQMRIVLAAVLTVHNERVEQPLRKRAETAEHELAELRDEYANLEAESSRIASRAGEYRKELAEVRDLLGNAKFEWASDSPGFFFTTPFSTEDSMRGHVREVRERGGDVVLKQRLVGEWKVSERQPESDVGDPS